MGCLFVRAWSLLYWFSKVRPIFLNQSQQKMRISQRQGQLFPQEGNNYSTRKENMPHGTSNRQPHYISFCQSPHSHHPFQLNPSNINQHCSPKPTNRIIELGGSKEKRDKATSRFSEETDGTGSGEGWARKVSLLEGRVKELHLEKQQLAVQLNKRLQCLEAENQRLIESIKNGEMKSTVSEEFDLEEELSQQINVNLELREQLQEANAQLALSEQQKELQVKEVNNLGEEKAELKLQLLQLQDSSADEIAALNAELVLLKTNLEKQDQSYRAVLQEREKRVLELEQENYSGQSRIKEQEQECQQLQREVASLTEGQAAAKAESEQWQARAVQLERTQECRKCKELMHTVFRLNSQLNKK